MIAVKLQGGLGNQMFQYAMGKALAARCRTDLVLDLEFLLDRTPKGPGFVFRDYDLDVFNLDVKVSTKGLEQRFKRPRWWQKIKGWGKPAKVFQETHFHFHEEFTTLGPDVYLEGYWQSARYFESVERELRKDFTFARPVEQVSQALLAQILSTESVCVNVRRADFLTSSFHGVCGMNYFAPAMARMMEKIEDPWFFIFSDDPVWCRENFSGHRTVVVDHAHKGYKFSNQLQLMAACKHFIVPNSTFAWWAVWLGTHPDKKVIAPAYWFNDRTIETKDLIPAEWIRIEN